MPLVPFGEAVRVWAKIGVLGFGGPAGQIALMHRELVEERRWIDDERFLHALNFCTLLPGPEAQQLATYIGWLLHKTRGALVAGTLFVLPGALVLLALSALYAGLRELPAVAALFFGLKAAVLAIVVEALVRIGKRALTSRAHKAVAVLAFVAIFCFGVEFPLLIAAAGTFGLVGRTLFSGKEGDHGPKGADAGPPSAIELMSRAGELAHTKPSATRALRVFAVCAALWALPVAVAAALLGGDSVLVKEAAFFSKTAVVTFGGAYAVLAYVAQEAVATYQWLAPGEMLDGLGLAETTPGPLILVVQFVGFLGAYRDPVLASPLLSGVLGALMTLWVTFVPCFLFILVGAPYVETLRNNRALRAALSAVTAAVVGVIANLSLWFALHVVFRVVTEHRFGPVRVLWPELSTLDPVSAALSLGSLVAMLRFKVSLLKTLAASAVLGAAYKLMS